MNPIFACTFIFDCSDAVTDKNADVLLIIIGVALLIVLAGVLLDWLYTIFHKENEKEKDMK